MTSRWLSNKIQEEDTTRRRRSDASSDRVIENLRGAASDNMAARMGEWKLYEYTQDPRPTLRIMVSPENRAAATLELRRDGTLRGRMPRWNSQENSPHKWTRYILNHAEKALEGRLTRDAVRLTGTRTLLEDIPSSSQWEIIQNIAAQQAVTILQKICRTASRNGKPLGVQYDAAVPTINRIIRERFTRREIEQLAQKSFSRPSEYSSLAEYNASVLNQSVFKTLLRDSPHVLCFYCRQMAPQELKPRVFRSPGELTAAVQEAIGTQGAQWAVFVRMGSPLTHGNSLGLEKNVRRIQLASKVIQEANCPQADWSLQREILKATHLHQFYQEAGQRGQWQHGNPWAAWVHLLNQAMQHSAREPMQLRKIGIVEDALRWHITNQQPWGPTSWENYQARSDRWHQEQSDQEGLWLLREMENSSWESLLADATLDGLDIHPITTGRELLETASTMSNCLATYRERCEQGTDRIFTISDQGVLLAAGQLCRNRNGGWTQGQLEGPMHQKPDERVKKVFQKTLELYNRLEKSA